MGQASSDYCPRCGAALDDGPVDGLCARCLSAQYFATDTAAPGESQEVRAAAFSAAEIAGHFPQLDVIEFLGRGGMGVVYKARQKSLGRLVALKLLAPERGADPRFAERFAREAQALAALSHPNIITIHDFGRAGRFYFLLMEYVDGVNLRQAMQAGRFTPQQALAVVPPVCEALQYAHEHGVVHCDIKPENLLLDKAGRVKIADFGIARMLGGKSPAVGLAESQPAGTPQYMAPEQHRPRAADHRADIYSLGVVLYELLTGELPEKKLQPPSRRVEIDVRIDAIVLRALEQQPELRYSTAAEFRTQVLALTDQASAATAAWARPAKPRSANELHSGRWSVVGTLALAFGIACIPILLMLALLGVYFMRRASAVVIVDGQAVELERSIAADPAETRTFSLRHELADNLAQRLQTILLDAPAQTVQAAADNHSVIVRARPAAMTRVRTIIAVTDWPDPIKRRPDFEYSRDTVLHAARSFFYACATNDSVEAISNLLSLHVLAELKGDTASEQYLSYAMGCVPDPEWEASLRGDWPGKAVAIRRLMQFWNRYPVVHLAEGGGVAIGFGVKHSCQVSFADAPLETYDITIEAARSALDDTPESYYFSSLPPWWTPGPLRPGTMPPTN